MQFKETPATDQPVDQKISLLLNMIRCTYPLFYCILSPEDHSEIYSDYPKDFTMGASTTMLAANEETLAAYCAGDRRLPQFLDNGAGLIWLIDGEWQEDVLTRIHVLGPVFHDGRVSQQRALREMDHYNFSVPLRARIMRQMEMVPVIPSVVLNTYGPMLHYAITGERISADKVFFSHGKRFRAVTEAMDFSTEHNGIWVAEQELLNAVREGDPNFGEAVSRSASLSSGVKMRSGDNLLRLQMNAVTLLTLVSRAAIEGGLNPSISYSLSDMFATRIANVVAFREVNQITDEIMETYTEAVRQAKEQTEVSRQVVNACDYIRLHLREPISIQEMADRFGYTEYYFSHKFHKETGVTIKEFIRDRRLEEAKVLLTTTNMSVQEISDELQIGSRSYFSVIFREQFGESPTDYRRKNAKI